MMGTFAAFPTAPLASANVAYTMKVTVMCHVLTSGEVVNCNELERQQFRWNI